MQVFIDLLNSDPFLFYTLVAAIFLATVSLIQGWARLDFLVFMKPRGLLDMALAVLCAFGLLILGETLVDTLAVRTSGTPIEFISLRGLSRFPLYIVTLAYGPSAGLLSASLFAAFATTSNAPGWPEIVLALELIVLGWFAIAPSPRLFKWAGPFNALIAYMLAWSTGGSAFLQWQQGSGMQFLTHWTYHQSILGSSVLSMLLLWFINPGIYRELFPSSRIATKAENQTRQASKDIIIDVVEDSDARLRRVSKANERWQKNLSPLKKSRYAKRRSKRLNGKLNTQTLVDERKSRGGKLANPQLDAMERRREPKQDLEPPSFD